MPRIRTIKPDFWCSEQIVECSVNARLLFIGLWNFCDDQGVHPGSTKRLKMEVFPGDAFTDGDVQAWIDELKQNGLVRVFHADGREWWHVTGWKHQKIERPSAKYPQPPFDDDSPNDQRTVRERSPVEKEKEKEKEKEGKRKPGKGSTITIDELEWPDAFGAEQRDAMQAWLDHHREMRKPYRSKSAVQKLMARFETRPQEFVDAVEWSIGQNYQGLYEEGKRDGKAKRKTTSGQQFESAAKGTW